MTELGTGLRDLATDLKTAVLFYTRIPLAQRATIEGADVARASWAAPLAGGVVGLIGAAIYWLARSAGLPPLAAAALTVTGTLLVTGGLHEDGLVDTVDGFGGGATRKRKLEIMRDSRIGTYGACAVTMSVLLRAGALAALADPRIAVAALIAAHAASRAMLPVFMWAVPRARPDGLSASAGRPPLETVIFAALLGVVALATGLGPNAATIALAILVGLCIFMANLCTRQVGGQTGDVLGALEQAGEIAILLTASASL